MRVEHLRSRIIILVVERIMVEHIVAICVARARFPADALALQNDFNMLDHPKLKYIGFTTVVESTALTLRSK